MPPAFSRLGPTGGAYGIISSAVNNGETGNELSSGTHKTAADSTGEGSFVALRVWLAGSPWRLTGGWMGLAGFVAYAGLGVLGLPLLSPFEHRPDDASAPTRTVGPSTRLRDPSPGSSCAHARYRCPCAPHTPRVSRRSVRRRFPFASRGRLSPGPCTASRPRSLPPEADRPVFARQ